MEGDLNDRRATASGEPSRNHFGVVEDEEITAAQQRRQISDAPILEPARCGHQQETGGIARLARVIGDQLARQSEIKIVDVHRIAR